ncbi:hypothetical protein MLD38_000561 [Melastoma candidum]|uniref:Uncharacterized protein n=1 Tax=Melastoma candidum TaxID=119954 RepID=A0ACB9SAJ2_9MYRT|nr:hypothetical protein MLD38_000561 [Melastoma candidum]
MNPPEGAETVRERTGSSLDVHAASRVRCNRPGAEGEGKCNCSFGCAASLWVCCRLPMSMSCLNWVSGVVGVVQTALWGAEPDEHPRPLVRRQAGITG